MNVTEVLAHPCRASSDGPSRVDVADRPEPFLDDLAEIAGLRLSERTAFTPDGRPAVSAMTTGSACAFADLHGGTGGLGSPWVGLDVPSRIVVGTVDGALVMVQTWAASEAELDRWLPLAAEVVESMRFVEPAPSQ
jgi:hypothetical protein